MRDKLEMWYSSVPQLQSQSFTVLLRYFDLSSVHQRGNKVLSLVCFETVSSVR